MCQTKPLYANAGKCNVSSGFVASVLATTARNSYDFPSSLNRTIPPLSSFPLSGPIIWSGFKYHSLGIWLILLKGLECSQSLNWADCVLGDPTIMPEITGLL